LIERSNGISEFSAALPATLDGKAEIKIFLSSGLPAALKFGFVEIR
jgi:hypothetical protein